MNRIETVDEAACTGCGICIDSCMMDVLRMDAETSIACIVYGEDCQGCFLCARDCPSEAITISQDNR